MKAYASLLSFTVMASCLLAAPLQSRAQSAAPTTPAKTLFRDGRDLMDDGKFGDAEKKFREALTRYPKADQSDRTSYYLIVTLIKLGRTNDARAEIQNFYQNYPQSTWKSDVDEKHLSLNGLPSAEWGQVQLGLSASPFNHANATPAGRGPIAARYGRNVSPSPQPTVTIAVNNPPLAQEILRLMIEQDLSEGIRISRERLKIDPSDPAVVANFNTIATANSPQVLTFLVTVAGNVASSPNARTMAIFAIGQRNDKEVGKAFIEVMREPHSLPVVVDAFGRFSVGERRKALENIVEAPVPQKTEVLENLYKASPNPQVRSQVVEAVGSIPDPATFVFLNDVARDLKEMPVIRDVAVKFLMRQNALDPKTGEIILKTNFPPAGARGPAK